MKLKNRSLQPVGYWSSSKRLLIHDYKAFSSGDTINITLRVTTVLVSSSCTNYQSLRHYKIHSFPTFLFNFHSPAILIHSWWQFIREQVFFCVETRKPIRTSKLTWSLCKWCSSDTPFNLSSDNSTIFTVPQHISHLCQAAIIIALSIYKVTFR